MKDMGEVKRPLVIRIVYDGAEASGKTVNVRTLGELLESRCTTKFQSPVEYQGRTLYFDWLELTPGFLEGVPLVCQLMTVPGHPALADRRRGILQLADAIVYVCDERHGDLRELPSGALDAQSHGMPSVPIVWQLNTNRLKEQPFTGAVSNESESHVSPIVEANARVGIGVVDTFMAALRLAVERLKTSMLAGGIPAENSTPSDVSSMFQRMANTEFDQLFKVELMLTELSDAMVRQSSSGSPIGRPQSPWGVPSSSAIRPPRLPSKDVPAGFVWPPQGGRKHLETVSQDWEMHPPDVHATASTVSVLGDNYVVSTSTSHRFDSVERAREALLATARDRSQMGDLLVPGTVFVIQSSDDSTVWLWTLSPRIGNLTNQLDAASDLHISRDDLVSGYGAALAHALCLNIRCHMRLGLRPENFAFNEGAVRSLGSTTRRIDSEPMQDVAAALLELSFLGADIAPAVEAFLRAVETDMTAEERMALHQSGTWKPQPIDSPAIHLAMSQIANAISGQS